MPEEIINQETPAGSEATQVSQEDRQPRNNEATAVPGEEAAAPQPGESPAPGAPAAEPSTEQAASIRLKGERDAAIKKSEETEVKLAFLHQERERERSARPSETETPEQRKQRYQDDGMSYTDAGLQALEDKFNSRREWDKLMADPAAKKDPKYEERIREIVKKFRLNTGDQARDAHFAQLEYQSQFGAQLPNDPASSIEKAALGGAPSGGGTPAPAKSKRVQARELYNSGKIEAALKMHAEAKKEEEQE